MTVDIIDLGWFYCLFIVFDQGNWPYFLLLLVDLSHLSLTIWGSIEFFKDLRQIIICYLEVPVLANFRSDYHRVCFRSAQPCHNLPFQVRTFLLETHQEDLSMFQAL
jgi:hypothetical protein